LKLNAILMSISHRYIDPPLSSLRIIECLFILLSILVNRYQRFHATLGRQTHRLGWFRPMVETHGFAASIRLSI